MIIEVCVTEINFLSTQSTTVYAEMRFIALHNIQRGRDDIRHDTKRK